MESDPFPLQQLRESIDEVDGQLLDLLARRRELSRQVARAKVSSHLPFFDDERERHLLSDRLRVAAERVLDTEVVATLWHTILADSVRVQRGVAEEGAVIVTPRWDATLPPLAGRRESSDTVIEVAGVKVGGPDPVVIAGPCAVESRDQVMRCAAAVRTAGGHMLRGGCFKPRTSPYSFQGLGYEGLEMLAEAGTAHGLPIVTEVPSPEHVGRISEVADVLQVGARNMQNFALLAEVGLASKPVLLKRGMSATIDELLQAAEYVLMGGNSEVILCERGIRTFEPATRNTLDVSAVPVLRERTHLPVIVDPSHAAGRRSLVIPLARAALAAGAHGVMVEIHPEPERALSDGPQALLLEDVGELIGMLRPS